MHIYCTILPSTILLSSHCPQHYHYHHLTQPHPDQELTTSWPSPTLCEDNPGGGRGGKGCARWQSQGERIWGEERRAQQMYNPLSTWPPATTTCTMHRTCMIHTMHTIFMPCCLTQTHHSPKPSPGGLVFGFQPNCLPSEAWYGRQPYNGSILTGNACYNKRSNIFDYLAAWYGQQPYNGSILPGNACYNKKSNVFDSSVK